MKIPVKIPCLQDNIFFILSVIKNTMKLYRIQIDKKYDDEKMFLKLEKDIRQNGKSYDDAIRIIKKYVEIKE